MGLKEIIIRQITSGRFLFTVVTALVFAYLSIKGLLPTDKVHDIILIVIYAYFNKRQDEKKEEGK